MKYGRHTFNKVLLSYPRSGSNWLQYSFYRITGNHIFGNREFRGESILRDGSHIKGVKIHGNDPAEMQSSQEDKVLMLLKNPIESILSNSLRTANIITAWQLADIADIVEEQANLYVKNLEWFSKHPEDLKKLMYFEDFNKDFNKYMKEFCEFFNGEVNRESLDLYAENIEENHKNCYKIYNSSFPNKPGNKISCEEINSILQIVRDKSESVFNEFLTRYETGE